MTREVDINLNEGDTHTITTPVEDGDDPNTDFYSDITNVTYEFTLVDSGGTEQIGTGDVTINTPQFQNVKLTNSAFPDVPSIPDSQEVVTVQIPATQTDGLVPGEEHRYQLRAENSSPTPTEKFTALRGSASVDASDL